jgi:NMD protein affecting ribosome stability and mRNA decay
VGLKPCPFCGEEAKYGWNPIARDMSLAQCRSCGASVYYRKWNRRHRTEAEARATRSGEVEALRSAARHALTFIENRFSDLSPEKRAIVEHLRAGLSTSEDHSNAG